MSILTAAASIIFFGRLVASLGVECGQPAIKPNVPSNFTGKHVVVPHSWPWHVGFYYHSYTAASGYFCSGALIDSRTVLTAAHCLAEPKHTIAVHLGDHWRSSTDFGEVLVNVSSVCRHPRFVRDVQDDLGVVRLSLPVKYSRTISPVCLPKRADKVRRDDELILTGWGGFGGPRAHKLSNILKQTRQKYISTKQCLAMDPTQLLDKVICTNQELGSTCHGDSGGPLVLARGGVWQLQGILSGGPSTCGDSTFPTFYSEVSEYLDWIRDVRASSDPEQRTDLCQR